MACTTEFEIAYSPSIVIFVKNDTPCGAREFFEMAWHRKLGSSYRHGRWMVLSWTRVALVSLGAARVSPPSFDESTINQVLTQNKSPLTERSFDGFKTCTDLCTRKFSRGIVS